ncbi:hypothetical protein Tco_0837225 [Tanacetum coccineum]
MGAYLIERIARHFRLMKTAALRLVTRGHETSLIDVVKLGELGIVRFNGLQHAKIVNEMLDNSDEAADVAKARRAQEENEGSPRRCPNISFTNRLRAMDDRLGEMDQHIYHIGNEVKEVTTVVSDLGVQQGVNFISSPQTYTNAPTTAPADPFDLFVNPRDIPSTSCQHGSDMDKE